MGKTLLTTDPKMMVKVMLIAGALFSFAGVAAGAFAAHGLKNRMTPEMFAIFEVGVRYHMYHALALLAVAFSINLFPQSGVHVAGYFFILGILIFSGSLYLLSLTGARWLGALTPVGGFCFLLGWLWIIWSVGKSL